MSSSFESADPRVKRSDVRPTPWRMLWIWLSLGLQSFGGGSATLTLMHRTFVGQYGWMTDAEFVREQAICVMTPGINLIGLTILVGRRVGGKSGVVVALAGLLLPSCLITVLITAVYAHYQGQAGVRAAIGGIIPATVGLGLIMAWQTARPVLLMSRREGHGTLVFSVALMAIAALLVGRWHLPVVFVLLGAGAVYAAAHTRQDAARRRLAHVNEEPG